MVPTIHHTGAWKDVVDGISYCLFTISNNNCWRNRRQLSEPFEQQLVALCGPTFMNQHQQWHHRTAIKHHVSVQETGDVKIAHTKRSVIVQRWRLCSEVKLLEVADHGRQTNDWRLYRRCHVLILTRVCSQPGTVKTQKTLFSSDMRAIFCSTSPESRTWSRPLISYQQTSCAESTHTNFMSGIMESQFSGLWVWTKVKHL